MKTLSLTCLSIAVLALFAGGCASVSINTETAENATWGNYRTYTWMAPLRGEEGQSSPFVRRVADRELQALGYTPVPEGSDADLLLGEHISMSTRLGVREVNDYYGITRWAAGFHEVDFVVPGTTRTYSFDRGQLVISIVDASTQELIWRGLGEGKILERASLERREKRLEDAVADVIRRVPAASQ